MNLRTGCTITRRTVTPIPMTQNIIDLVHDLATRDGMPDGLKIQTKTGQILYDSACIAGVDTPRAERNYYAPLADEEDDDNYDPSEEDDDDDDDDDDDEDFDQDDGVDPEDSITVQSEQSEEQEAAPVDENVEDDDEEDAAEPEDAEQDAQEAENTENVEEEEAQESNTSEANRTRSGRTIRAPERLIEQSHLQTQGHAVEEYSAEIAKVIGKIIHHCNTAVANKQHKHHAFVETYSLK